jgi:ribonuclease G
MSVARELLLHSNGKGLEIALLENNILAEYHLEGFGQDDFSTGNIFLGRVKKINPGLNAAFVDIGSEKDAFIHYSDLSPNFITHKNFVKQVQRGEVLPLNNFKQEHYIEKEGKIDAVITKGDYVLCQIMKESISTKGPRLTCELSIPGRYIVLSPFGQSIGISKKIISEDERLRLIEILKKIKPQNFGLIVRTNAENVEEEVLKQDIDKALQVWREIVHAIIKEHPPKLLFTEHSKSFTMVRDLLNDSFERVTTDDEELHTELKSYVESHIPIYKDLVSLYKGNNLSLFDKYEVYKQLRTSFGKVVNIKQGAYIIIEHTEALHVIDVNSGPKIKSNIDQDANAFGINVEAAHEIARQLRLRDIGGIIVVDFIDMKSQAYKNQLLEIMYEAMRNDKAKHTLLPISKFGLMEITRQRTKAQKVIDVEDKTVEGINPWSFMEEVMRKIADTQVSEKVFLHPIIATYVGVGIVSKIRRYFKYKKWIDIVPDGTKNLFEYEIV